MSSGNVAERGELASDLTFEVANWIQAAVEQVPRHDVGRAP